MPLPVSQNPVARSRRRLVADYEKTSQGLRTWGTVLPPRPPVAPPSPRPPSTSPLPHHERWILAADDAAWQSLSQRCVILPPRATPHPPTPSLRPSPRDLPTPPSVPISSRPPPVPLMSLKVVPTLGFIQSLPRLMDLVVSPLPRRRPTLRRHPPPPVPGPSMSSPHHRHHRPIRPSPFFKTVATQATVGESTSPVVTVATQTDFPPLPCEIKIPEAVVALVGTTIGGATVTGTRSESNQPVIDHTGLYVDCGFCGLHFKTFKELSAHEETDSHGKSRERLEKLAHRCLLCEVTVTSGGAYESHKSGKKHRGRLIARGDLRGLGWV